MKINVIPLSTILVSEARQRSDVPEKHVGELVESIRSDGLFNPLVLDQNGMLVAGDCRRRALEVLAELNEDFYFAGTEIQPGFAPVTVTHQTDETALYRIELEENIRRQDLSPIDRAAAIAKLHQMRVSENPSHTQKATALELADIENNPSTGSKEVEVAESLILAEFKDDPDVRKAGTKAAALKVAKTKMQNQFLQSLGAQADATDSEHTLICGDASTVIRSLPSESFDGIVSDPPYGVGADTFGDQSFTLGHKYADTAEQAVLLVKQVLDEGLRLLSRPAAVYLFCDIRLWANLADLAGSRGYYVWPTPLIWYKGTTGHCPRPGSGPKRVYEAILFATLGDKRTIRTGCDVLSHQPVRSKRHAAEKPVPLLQEILSWSFAPGDRILDPFAGSGTIFPAATAEGLTATGIELSEECCDLARQRLIKGEEDGNDTVDLHSLFN